MKKLKLITLLTSLIINSVALADLNTGLMAYYNFDDCSANDTSGNNNNGTINGNLSCVTGTVNKAFQFNGKEYIDIPSSASLNPNKEWTISFWVRVDKIINDWSVIMVKGGSVYQDCHSYREYEVFLYKKPNLGQEISGDGKCGISVSSKSISIGKWMYYTSVVDLNNHTMKIYINGKLNNQVAGKYSAFNNNNNDLRIGSTLDSHSLISAFNGALDEIRLYNRVLTPNEISNLYNQGISINGSINSIGSHAITCRNETTGQIINIPANQVTSYNCEAKGLKANIGDDITILIKGKNQ